MDIKTLRNNAHMSQTQFAKVLKIPLKTIQSWENGTRKPPIYIPELIQKALEVDGFLPMT